MVIARRGTIYREMLVGEMLERRKNVSYTTKFFLKVQKKTIV